MEIKKTPWDEVQKDFAQGMRQIDICKKYKIKPTALNNQITRKKWRISQDQKEVMAQFEKSTKDFLSAFQTATPSQQSAMEAEAKRILKRQNLELKGIDFANQMLDIAKQGADSGIFATPSDIRQGMAIAKDSVFIANPQPKILNQNANISQNEVKFIIEHNIIQKDSNE